MREKEMNDAQRVTNYVIDTIVSATKHIDGFNFDEAMKTCCVFCELRHKCGFAFAPINVGKDPQVNCIAKTMCP